MPTISNLDRYSSDVDELIALGQSLFNSLRFECFPVQFEKVLQKQVSDSVQLEGVKKALPVFRDKYQTWYSEAQAIIKLLLPDRLSDFIKYYEKPKTRKDIRFENYVIEDCLQGVTLVKSWNNEKIVGPDAAIPRFEQQLNILKACKRRFESSLFDIRQLVQADLFDSELEAAKELSKSKFFRAAGALAGVVLEKHLLQVCDNHGIHLTKANPTINDFNETLKQNSVVDIPQWRFIQHLGDIRNLCDHNKKIEPTAVDIVDLITGVEKIAKTLF